MSDEEFNRIDGLIYYEFWNLPEDLKADFYIEKKRREEEAFRKIAGRTYELRQDFSPRNSTWENGRCVDAFQYRNECGGYKPAEKRGNKYE